jgi:hypothetical protein
MLKMVKKSPANKRIKGCPSFIHNDNDLLHDISTRTREKFVTVQIVTSNPHIDLDKFSINYDAINWHKKETV